MAVVDELISILGIDVDSKAAGNARGFEKLIAGVTKAAINAGIALTSAGAAIVAYAAAQSSSINEAGKFADSIGVAYENLQKLEFAAEKAGGSASALRGDLDGLTKSMSSPIPGEYNQGLFMLGIATRDASGKLKSADQILIDIAGRMEGMSKQKQMQIASKLGISSDTLKLIQQGKVGINSLRAEAVKLGLVLDESAKVKAARFQNSLLNIRSIVKGLGQTIAVGLLPKMTETIEKFEKWIAKNKEIISGGIGQLLEGVGRGFDMVGNAIDYALDAITDFIGPSDELSEALDYTQVIALLVAGAMGVLAVSTLAALAPYLLIAAAVAAVVLVIDDLYSALNGGDSYIGEWAKSFSESFPNIISWLKLLYDMFVTIVSFLGSSFVLAFKSAFTVISAIIKAIVATIANTFKAIEKILSGANPFAVLGDLFKEQFDIIMKMASEIGSGIWDNIKSVFTGSSTMANIPASTIANTNKSSNVNNNITNNINGAGNPSAVADEFMRRGGLGTITQTNSPGLVGPMSF